MKRTTPFYILALLLFVSACSSMDCPLNSAVYTNYGLYKTYGVADTLTDTISVITWQRQPNQDPVIVNKDAKISSLSLPISYEHPEDYFVFQITNHYEFIDTLINGTDTTVIDTMLTRYIKDTVIVRKDDLMHFESVECNPSYFHHITGVECTHHAIDSIVINNAQVDYDTSTEHFRLYFKSDY